MCIIIVIIQLNTTLTLLTGFSRVLKDVENSKLSPGNVVEFYEVRKCPETNIVCDKIHLEQRNSWINIMPVEEYCQLKF